MRKSVWFVALLLTLPLTARADVALTALPNGQTQFDNGVVKATLGAKPGRDEGIRQWFFVPTGHEMVDLLYGQTDYIGGSILGEVFDKVAVNATQDSETYGVVAGGVPPFAQTFYVTDRAGQSEGGRGALIEQVAMAGGYRLTRTVIFRRDLAAVEARYVLENISGPQIGTTFRLFGAMSPGARGKVAQRKQNLFIPLTDGILCADQSLKYETYIANYGQSSSFFPPAANTPVPTYARQKRPLADKWAAMVDAKNGDGMVFVGASPTFMGFYGHPGTSLEQFFKSADLAPGSKFEYRTIVGSFTGAAGVSVADATALYVAVEPMKLDSGKLSGKVIPLFKGKLQLIDASGAVAGEWAASPDAAVAISGNTADGWSIRAIDTKGQDIGTVDAKGDASLATVDVPKAITEPPTLSGDMYVGDEKIISNFLATRDFTVYCDDSASRREKQAAREIASKLGVGLIWSRPSGKLLVVGEPSTNATVTDVGRLRHSISKEWPGADRGAVVAYDNFESTANPILLVTGGDDVSVARAAKVFEERFLKDVQPPKGVAIWAPEMEARIYPYSRPPANAKASIAISAARGEYEPAMVAFTAYETAKDISVTVSPLKNRETGGEIGSKYLTKFRQKNGPVWVRWINYYPVKPEGGWTGYPDPLLEQGETLVPAGETRGLWITFIVPDDAQAGMYDATLTLKCSAGEKTVPIQLEVYDFTIPATGLKGHPYMAMDVIAPEGRELTERQITPLVNDLVEHGMRLITPSNGEMFRWSFSPKGEFKGFQAEGFEVSEDGKVMLDATRWAETIAICDKAAKPFPLMYTVYAGAMTSGYGDFKRALPNRYPDKEAIPAKEEAVSKSWYGVEMYQMVEKYLQRTKMIDRVLVKVADEPPGFNSWYDKSCWSIRHTKLQIFTAFNNLDPQDAERALGSQLKLWQPLYQITDQAFLDRAKASGAMVSWYNCGPPPRTSVGEVRSALRAYLWQAAKANLDVVSWWGVQCWPQAGGRDAVWNDKYAHWHSLIYPPHPTKVPVLTPGKSWIDAGPLDSMRWEFIRDGMDDAAYVIKLRELIAQAEKANRPDLADQGKAVLDDIWKNVFPTLNDYRPPYDTVMTSRDRVAREVVLLGSALKGK